MTQGVQVPGEIELSIVMPCLDESETLERVIRKAWGSIESLGVRGEVVVADNGSTDGSQDIALRCGAIVVDVPVRGYGAALRAGFEAARGRYVIMGDSDDQHALDDLGAYLAALRGGADFVIGNRFAGGIQPGAMPALHRYLGNPVLSFLGRLFFKIPVHDFNCGLRGFRRDKVLALGLQTTGMEFASEMIVRAAHGKLRMVEVPTVVSPPGRTREAHLRTWRDGWRHLKFLLAFSPRWLYYYPSLLLLWAGVAVMLLMARGPVDFGVIGFGTPTLIAGGAMAIVGLQGVGMALVARMFSARLHILPRSGRMDRFFSRWAMEHGLALGTVLALAGITSFVLAVTYWGGPGHDVFASIRASVIGLVLLFAGAQFVFLSFILSLTRMESAEMSLVGHIRRPGEPG